MKGFLIVILIFVVLIIGIGYLYYVIEKPFQERAEWEYYNASFIVKDNGEPVSSELQIVLQDNPNEFYLIETQKDGYVNVQLPTNKSFRVFNKVNFTSTYYTKRYSYFINQPQNLRINVDLERIGDITLNQTGDLSNDNVNLTLKVNNGTFRFINFCLRWDSGIISVETDDDYIKYEEPQRLQGLVDSCYKVYRSLLNENEKRTIPLYINKWSNEDIGLKIYIMDGDIRWNSIDLNNNGLDSYLIEVDGKDIGKKDILYEFK